MSNSPFKGPGPPSPDGLLAASRAGDAASREELISRYTPFVLRAASQTCGRFVKLGSDDEASVALMAFNEAIDCYEYGRGVAFLTFAEVVIKRRVVDYLRKCSRADREVPISALQEAGRSDRPPLELGEDKALWAQAEEEVYGRRLEIEEFRNQLGRFGIKLEELVDASPKHADARQRALEVAQLVAGREDLREHLFAKRELPVSVLAGSAGVSRKTIERQRKYIIALAIILSGDFPFLKEYLRPFLEKEGGN